MRDIAPGLDDQSVRLLTTYAIAGADGLFIAKEVGGDSVDLIELLRPTRPTCLRRGGQAACESGEPS